MDESEEIKLEIPLERCAFWIDPKDNIQMSVPNDISGSFLCMFDGVSFSTNAYPKHVWELWGWQYLDPVIRDRISDALTELD